MKGNIRSLLAALAVLLAPMSVHAVDGFALEGGWELRQHPKDDAFRLGGALVWDWGVKWLQFHDWYLGGQWEASVSYWDGSKGNTGNGSLADFGITPVFRIQTDDSWLGVRPFLEGAIGAHLFTETEIGDRRFGINYSFGDHLGGGIRFGDRGQYEINYRFQHLSHLVGSPNNGINFQLIRFGYHW